MSAEFLILQSFQEKITVCHNKGIDFFPHKPNTPTRCRDDCIGYMFNAKSLNTAENI